VTILFDYRPISTINFNHVTIRILLSFDNTIKLSPLFPYTTNMSSKTNRLAVVLAKPEDWYPWIELVETAALKHKIWDFIDPATHRDILPKLIMPQEPTYSDVRPPSENEPARLSTFEDLTAGQVNRFQYLQTRFLTTEKRFLVQEQALLDIREQIQGSVSLEAAFNYTMHCPHPYDMLIKLKARFCPSTRQREQQLRAEYQALFTLTSTQEVEIWMQRWESVVQNCREINLPDTQQDRPQHDFVRATRDRYPAFYTFQNGLLLRNEVTEFIILISQFREHLRYEEPPESRGRHGAFSATFQGQDSQNQASQSPSSGSGSNQSSNEGSKSSNKCICGKNHRYYFCFYLNPLKRPQNWQPDPTIQKQIDQKISQDPKLKGIIQKFQLKAENKGKLPELATAMCATYFPETGLISSNTGSWALYNSFILDSGATTHICHTRERFNNFRIASESLLAGGGSVQIEGWGDVNIQVQGDANTSRLVTLKNTAYIPSFTANIVSLKRVNIAGIYWDQLNNRLVQGGNTFCQVICQNNHFVLELKKLSSDESAFIAHRYTKSTAPKPDQVTDIQTLHRRFAHAGIETIRHVPSTVLGIDLIDPESPSPQCEVCPQAKAKRQINREPVPLPQSPYEVVSFDLIEEMRVERGKYIMHFYCRFSGMHHVYILFDKAQGTLVRTIKDFYAYINQRWGCKISIFHTDGEKGLGLKYDAWTASLGITTNTSAPYTQDQNGAAERSGRVILERARAMQIDSELPQSIWPEIVCAAGYILNRTPRQDLDWTTPLYKLQSHLGLPNPKPKCGHIRIYGCRAYPLLHDIPKTDKLAPRAAIGYLIGWDSTNIFRIWVPLLRRIIRSRDVTFDETIKYDPYVPEPPLLPSIVDVIAQISLPERELDDEDEYIFAQPQNQPNAQPAQPQDQSDQAEKEQEQTIIVDTGIITPEDTPEPTSALPSSIAPSNALSNAVTASIVLSNSANQSAPMPPPEYLADDTSPNLAISTPRATITRKSYDTSQGVQESNIIQGHRERKPRREAYMASLECPEELISYHTGFMAGTSHSKLKGAHRTSLPPPPSTWNQLEKHPLAQGFKAAAQKEFQDLESRSTWRQIDSQEASIRPLPLKWVFTYKFDTDGYLDRFKARICVRGDLQPFNNQDNYAATLAAKVFRSLMAITAAFDLEAVQLDAINAFINGTLDEEVYTYMPDGFKAPGKVLRLERALYGLRRSPLIWLQEFSRTLSVLGLTQIPESQCLYTNGRLLVFFYVDDVVILYHRDHYPEFQEFKDALLRTYDFKDLGTLKWFLGIRILRDRTLRKLWLCQDSYIEKVARTFNLIDGASFKTPLATEEIVPNQNQATPQEIHAFQARIGSTTYPTTITRPDAARASNKLAQYLLNPSPLHTAAANRLIQYLYATRYLAIEYSQNGSTSEVTPDFRCCTDAAYGDDIPSRQSTEGYLFKLFGGPIDWRSTRQKQVTKSSTEAELMALSHAATELYWWRRFFTSITLILDQYPLECDNQQTIRLMTTPAIKLATKLKHVDIHQHWLRQEVQEKRLNIDWIPTADMPADGLTKALPGQKHTKFIKQLGLIDIQPLLIVDQ
jgi:hypothetical protein